jgi:hypothetical protein
MAGMRTEPMAEVSATAEPETPLKIMEAAIFTWLSPPWIWPIMAVEKPTSRRVIPPAFIRSPARMKNGTHKKAKLFRNSIISAAIVVNEEVDQKIVQYTTEASPILMNTGRPSRAKAKKLHNSTTNGKMPT